MTSFDPTQDYGTTTTTSSGTAISKLPDGSLDLYGLGAIANTGIFSGSAAGPGLSDGSKGHETYGATGAQGNSYTPAYQIVQKYAKMSATDPNSYASLQSELYSAGNYSGTTVPKYGVWTAKDGDALSEAMRGYLAVSQTGVPITFEEWLSKASAQGAQDSLSASPITLTDTATLDSKANAAGQTDLGRNLSSSEQQSFVDKFHGEEIDAANQKASAKLGTGQPVIEDPSRYDAQSAADQSIQTSDNGEYQTHLQAGYGDAMLSMLGVK